MDYLYSRNRWLASGVGPKPMTEAPAPAPISAKGKHVVVIGGGDTGADCVGHSIPRGAAEVVSSNCCPNRPSIAG